jgi:hypothetical protein
MARTRLGTKLTTKPGGVPLRDGLPRFDEDRVAFIVERLPEFEPITVPNFLRAIGFNPKPNGVNTTLYLRYIDAFQTAEEEGKLTRNGFKYRTAQTSAPAQRQARAS